MQIGPKIRIGGTLGKVGQNVKNTVGKALTDTGHAVGNALDNPAVKAALVAALAATGVGAPAAAAIMAGEGLAGGALKNHGGLRPALVGGATGALEGGGGALAGKALGLAGKMPGVGSVGDLLHSGVSQIPGALRDVGGNVADAVGKLGLDKIVPRAADGSIDWGKVAKGAATALPMVQGYNQANAANKYAAQQRGAATGYQEAMGNFANGAFSRMTPGATAPSTNYLALLKGNKYGTLVQPPAGG